MTNNYFSNPNLINVAKTAVEILQNAGRPYEDIAESLHNAVIETEKEVPFVHITEKMIEGRAKRAAKGQLPSGYITGYDSDKNGNFVTNEQAPIVAEIFDLYVYWENAGQVVKNLKKQNMKTRHGKDFSRQSVLNILSQPAYCGKGLRWKGEIHKADIPKIVTTNKWNKAQKIMASRSRTKTK